MPKTRRSKDERQAHFDNIQDAIELQTGNRDLAFAASCHGYAKMILMQVSNTLEDLEIPEEKAQLLIERVLLPTLHSFCCEVAWHLNVDMGKAKELSYHFDEMIKSMFHVR